MGARVKGIGGYEFLQQAAVGSTGVVWQARQLDLGRLVAVKELSAALRSTPDGLARFRAEAARLAKLDDDHVVKIYDYVEADAGAFIVQEWVDGETLEHLVGRVGQLTAEQSVGVLRGALLGLAAAHDLRLVHGDVSPTNILLDRAGTSKLIDFGIATAVGDSGRYGTPAYMSPEAVSGAGMLPASDVYSAAAVLFTLLSGKPPMAGADVAAVLRQHLEDPPPRLVGHGAELQRIVQTAMAKDPHVRPADARAFLRELEQAAERRFGAAWLSRASVAGLVAGGVEAVTIATRGGGGSASVVSAPVVVAALDQEVSVGGRRRRRLRKAMPVAAAALILAAAGTVTAVATTGGKKTQVVSSSGTVVPKLAPTTPKPKPAVVVRPAAGASVEASAAIVTTFSVSGACSGQGGFKSGYRFVSAHVPVAANGLALKLSQIPGAVYVVGPPATVQCPGFSFPVAGTGVDKVLTTGTIGQTLRLVATDVTKTPGLPAGIPADNVFVEVDAIPQFTGKGLALRACNAVRGTAHTAAAISPYPCLPANTTYRITLPLAAAATTCEAKSSPAANPVNVGCRSSGTLILVIRTYARPPKPAPTVSATSNG